MNDVDTIPIKYSRYAYSLDKVFKSNSLENLKKKLKNPKKYKISEFGSFLNEKKDLMNL